MDNDTTKSGNEIDTNRGIENAQARFERRSKARTTSAELQGSGAEERMKAREEDRRAADSLRTKRENVEYENLSTQTVGKRLKLGYQSIRKTFKDEGETIDDAGMEEIMEMKGEKTPLPPFPYFIFTIAVLKDLTDVVATATIIGSVITPALSFLCALILFIWTMGKISGWFGQKKKIIAKVIIKFFIMFGVELVPGVNIIPTTVIFVLMAQYDETKIVKLINKALEQMHGAGIK